MNDFWSQTIGLVDSKQQQQQQQQQTAKRETVTGFHDESR